MVKLRMSELNKDIEEKKERVSIFIDGSNLYNGLKRLNIKNLDFQKLINKLIKSRNFVNAFYYIASLDITFNKTKYWKHQEFLNNLKKIPKFNVVLCTLRKIVKKGEKPRFEIKGDDIHLAVDLISGAHENLFDTAIIVSGDEDFVPVINKVRCLGKRVENAYFTGSSSAALKKRSNLSIC